MTGWLLPWLKKNLIYSPELVDHYITSVRCWPKIATYSHATRVCNGLWLFEQIS
jgi:hypothetical protein